jgi:hypothetical protein
MFYWKKTSLFFTKNSRNLCPDTFISVVSHRDLLPLFFESFGGERYLQTTWDT